ncbi:hypothetical protein ADIS_0582 [Lunatimonas lonarensis]|uniref:Uncharacterized protein n=1 Tax=Lunatimonas lonarensis TaxID=1232681 RepID=R7ZY83_9BACT|nr:hypothetical protein ADIS_0582 [Lunatimonas lonarensis]
MWSISEISAFWIWNDRANKIVDLNKKAGEHLLLFIFEN